MVKLAGLLFSALAGGLGALAAAECNTPPPGPPPVVLDASPGVIDAAPSPEAAPVPSPPSTPLAVVLYTEMVEGGCMAADPDAGVALMIEALADSNKPPWLACLADGGSVTSCQLPCGPAEAGASKLDASKVDASGPRTKTGVK